MASLYTPAEIAEVQRVAAEAAVAEAKDSTLKEGQEAAFRVGSTVQQVPVGKGDKLPIIPAGNRRQWVREDLGAH